MRGYSAFCMGLGLVAALHMPAMAENKGVTQEMKASLTIDLDGPARPTARHSPFQARPVSPMLYGIFFEDINHAADGGLYAELVRNRSFEDTVVPERCTVENGMLKTSTGWSTPFPDKDPMPGWKPIIEGGATGVISLDDKETVNDANPRSLRIEVAAAGEGRVGVANEGFWGIAVKAGASYRFSMFAKGATGFTGPLSVSLESANGGVYAREEVKFVDAEWRRYELLLESNGGDKEARLVIAARRPGVFWVDVVSLFPKDTWKGRENGLRADLAEMLADLQPAFVRFPGGCFVEGFTVETALRWKNTIGPVEERKGHWNLWGYRTTNGLGYHELLQMCEDLKAEPMFVINCGMACQGRGSETVPMDQLEPWVQDALDAIEYANGPASNKWGALRAANGHPEPFNLKYLEIGNENSGPAYEERYRRFYEVIRDKHPDVRLIANCAVKSAPVDILDEHYYSAPNFFASRSRQYDGYDRKGPRIYVGEYAVTAGCGKGNLRAAVAEAAFMTGMERNSDIVIMSSYAPLFVNVNDRRWNPDAICFDNASCYGTPSYHVQAMFSRNRADTSLPLDLKCETIAPRVHGAIGLATWKTRAEYKDVKVTAPDGTLLFASDFAKDPAGWKPLRGEWSVVKGAYRQSPDAADLRAVAGDSAWTDYTLTLKARKISGEEGFMVLFRVIDEQNWVWLNLGGWHNAWHGMECMRNGQKSLFCERVGGSIETGRWYDVRVELAGAHIRGFLDNQLVQEADLPAVPTMAAVAGRRNADGAILIKVVNMADAPQDADLMFNTAAKVGSTGTEEVLTSSDPANENSLAEPLTVAPKTREITDLGAQFRHTFPPNSVTILRLKTS